MPLHDRVRLQHMLDAAEQARSFCADMDEVAFAEDARTHRAVHNCLQVIGEAANHVTEPTRTALPEIPWRQIVRMRNILVHVYFDINTTLIWRVVVDDLPPLIVALRTHLSQQEPDA